MGVPRSVLLGRVVQPGEPLWLSQDTLAVLEYIRDEATRCPGCGLPVEETQDPDNEGAYVGKARRCHACGARDREAQRFQSQKHDDAGLYFTVERREE